jgi:hypothetical protein
VDIDASCADSGGCFARQCGLASGAIDDQLLIAGFDTASFDIQGAASGLHVVFSWTPPPGAVAVSCALFICAPEFGPAAGATSIINFSECAIAQTTRPASDPKFDLGDVDAGVGSTSSACATATLARAQPVVSTLRVGCWAYDPTGVVGASPLKPIAPAEAVASGPLIDEKCAGDGDNCVVSPGVFGTCHGGQCRSRCLTDSDCVAAGGDGDGGAVDASSDGGTLDGSEGGADGGAGPGETCLSLADAGNGAPFGVCLPGDAG